MQFLTAMTPQLTSIGLTILRISIGLLFIGHGYLKLSGGIPELLWTGEQMKHLGITFAPLFWGISAMLSELLGGIGLTLGLGTRIAALLLSFTMLVAIIYHISNGDSYGYYSFPMSQLAIFVALFVAGGGYYSLDHYFFG
jgi:putative oxidoreductase